MSKLPESVEVEIVYGGIEPLLESDRSHIMNKNEQKAIQRMVADMNASIGVY